MLGMALLPLETDTFLLTIVKKNDSYFSDIFDSSFQDSAILCSFLWFWKYPITVFSTPVISNVHHFSLTKKLTFSFCLVSVHLNGSRPVWLRAAVLDNTVVLALFCPVIEGVFAWEAEFGLVWVEGDVSYWGFCYRSEGFQNSLFILISIALEDIRR